MATFFGVNFNWNITFLKPALFSSYNGGFPLVLYVFKIILTFTYSTAASFCSTFFGIKVSTWIATFMARIRSSLAPSTFSLHSLINFFVSGHVNAELSCTNPITTELCRHTFLSSTQFPFKSLLYILCFSTENFLGSFTDRRSEHNVKRISYFPRSSCVSYVNGH
jgi:hypothetical protein